MSPGLNWHPMEPADLAELLEIDAAHLGEELVGRDRAMSAWIKMMKQSCFRSAVIVSEPAMAGRRTVGVGASVFVKGAFADAALAEPEPGLNARIVRSVDCGCPVILNDSQIRAANTFGGLDVVVLCGTWLQEIRSSEQTHRIRTVLAGSFMEVHAGYRIKRLLVELASARDIDYATGSGIWRIASAYENFYKRNAENTWSRGRKLAVIETSDAWRSRASVAGPLFDYHAPQLGLREADQRLLTAALPGLTDEELAEQLNTSVSSVKKRWVTLFDRVAKVRPDLLGEAKGEEGQRGRQKRHRIVAYVRQHPEELRPWDPILARRTRASPKMAEAKATSSPSLDGAREVQSPQEG